MNWLWQGFHNAAMMLWETLWALVLGLALSAALRVFCRNEQVAEQFGKTSLRSVTLATLFGAASSSCSYAASAAGRTAFQKGAALVPMLAFMFASTNLVFELALLLWRLLGWQFVLAEAVGAVVLIALMWLIVKFTYPKNLVEAARGHGGNETHSCCHGGCGDMEDDEEEERSNEPFSAKIRRRENWRQMARAFRMDTAMLWKEMLIGFLIAGFLMALVPETWWRNFFITSGPDWLRVVENAIAGPLVAMASFVCSCGNIPLAGVLWSGGISFGGVVAFIYADLLALPLLIIYRKYYGTKMALYIAGVMFVSVVLAGIIVDLLFGALGLIPTDRTAAACLMAHGWSWNLTTFLNIAAMAVLAVMLWAGRSAPMKMMK